MDFDAWIASSDYGIPEEPRAVDAWLRILDKPTTLQIMRDGTLLPPQVIRLEHGRGRLRTSISGEGSEAQVRHVVLFGVKNHPDPAVADTDVEAGDRFSFDGKIYEIFDKDYVLGEVHCRCQEYSRG